MMSVLTNDFFELGGNSLEAMLVVSHLKRFGHHISMQTLYQYKTVRQIVNYMYQNQQSLVALPDNLSELQKIVMSRYNLGILEDSLSHRPLRKYTIDWRDRFFRCLSD